MFRPTLNCLSELDYASLAMKNRKPSCVKSTRTSIRRPSLLGNEFRLFLLLRKVTQMDRLGVEILMKYFLIGLLFFPGVTAYGQLQKSSNIRAKDAIRIARQATTEDAREEAYKSIGDESIQDDDDIQAIYDEMKNLLKGIKDIAQSKQRLRMGHELAGRLELCRSPEQYAAIKRLLKEEVDNVPLNFMGRWSAKTPEDEVRDGLIFERLQALISAAGEGGNESALPELRKLRRKGGEAGRAAEKAIGQIGDDQDFEEMIKELKANPKSQVNLNVFGPRAMHRIVKEIKDPAVPKHEKVALLGAFPKYVQKDDVSALVELLDSEDRKVVEVASEALRNSVTDEDEKVIRQMLSNPHRSVRSQALISINRLWNLKYLPDILKILKTDSDDWQRAYAAKILGDHKVSEAKAALREASTRDSVLNVRESAQYALRKME